MPHAFFLYPFREGERLRLKKTHPCGSAVWIVERVGADVGLRCAGCDHRINIARAKLEKALRCVEQAGEEALRDGKE